MTDFFTTKYYNGINELNLLTNHYGLLVYNGNSYTPQQLYNIGITPYPTRPILVFNGDVISLYDERTNLYFDRRQNINVWSNENPTPFYNGDPSLRDLTLDQILVKEIVLNNNEIPINYELYVDNYQKTLESKNWNGCLIQKSKKLNRCLSFVTIDTQYDYEILLTYYVQDENGQTINEIYYSYGDYLTVTKKRTAIAGIEYIDYISQQLFGDTNNHTEQQLEDAISFYNLSEINPIAFVFGITTELPQQYNTMPKTHWWWCGGFSQGSTIANWYTSSNYATQSVPQSDSEAVTISQDNKYQQCVISNGSTTTEPITLKLANYNNSPEFYATGTDISRSSTPNNNVIVVLHNSSVVQTTWDLPSGLYTLSGRTITWNTNNAYYKAFYGKQII